MKFAALTFLALALCAGSASLRAQSDTQLMLDEYAPAADDLAAWAENAAVLTRLGTVPEYADRTLSEKEQKVRQQLEEACMEGTFPDCQAFLRANRPAVRRVVPDNPQFWALFWRLQEGGALFDLSGPLNDQLGGFQPLLVATQWWFYKDLADDGRLDLARAQRLQEAITAWLSGHQTLMGRMIVVAMQDMVFNQLSFAMAQAGRSRDMQRLQDLARAVAPLELGAMSWGPVLWVEQQWGVQTILQDWPAQVDEAHVLAALALAPEEVTEAQIRALVEDPTAVLKADNEVIARHFVPVTTLPWTRYWAEGVPPLDADKFGALSFAGVTAPAYAEYVARERATNFRRFLFPALADVYAGRVSPGVPARPAPARWRWEWREGPQPALCLVSDTVHASTRQMPEKDAETWCVDYYDETAVAKLHVR